MKKISRRRDQLSASFEDTEMLDGTSSWIEFNSPILLDAIPDAVLVVDDHGSIVFLNLQTEKLFSYPRSELIGHSVECLIPERYRGQHRRNCERFVADSCVRHMDAGLELFGMRKDGTEFPVEISLSPVTTEEGKFVISAIRDVSERKLAEAQIRKLNDDLEQALLQTRTHAATSRLAAIVESSADAIFAYSCEGVITDWNQGATQLYGYSAEEVIGQNISIIVPANRSNELTEILNTLAGGRPIRQRETVRQRKDGSLADVSFSASPITGPNGTVIGGAGITQDISRRKRMEGELRKSEERFWLVSRATNDALFDHNYESGTVWWSDNYWTQFGYSPEANKFTFADWKDAIHPEDRDRVWNGFQNAVLRRAESYKIEYRLRRADGSYANLIASVYIVYNEAGEPTRTIGALTDLSDRRELEEQFRQAQKMEAVGRLAGGVAHDFNNLLMVISAYSEMMRDKLNPEDELQMSIAQVQKAADRAASLTRQLLAFSRKQVLLPRIIDVNSVVEDSLKMIRRLIGEDIELNISLGKPLWAVKADPGQLVQVLMNLCVNAQDAMPHGGELEIQTNNVSIDLDAARKMIGFVPGNYAALIVSDTGTGMTREVQARLFEPFFTTKESGRGTGLGLSTVFGIVKQSGGYIWVDSEPGEGSSFTIYMPAVDAPVTATIKPEITDAEGQGEVILLVEDDGPLRESISTYLNLHGYKVLEASNGAEALSVANQHAESIQVLITDMILPKMRGEEVAKEVAKVSPQAATLYMSGYTDRDLIDYDPASLTTGFLQKPFALQTLLQKLREMIMMRG